MRLNSKRGIIIIPVGKWSHSNERGCVERKSNERMPKQVVIVRIEGKRK